MEKNNMTAVEWLEEQLLLHTKIENSKYVQQEIIDVAMWQFNKYLKQAKQMEKEQIIDAWMAGDNDGSLEPKLMEGIAGEYYDDMYSQEDKNPQHKNIRG